MDDETKSKTKKQKNLPRSAAGAGAKMIFVVLPVLRLGVLIEDRGVDLRFRVLIVLEGIEMGRPETPWIILHLTGHFGKIRNLWFS